MFAKLFARITESSLMEEEIPVRYTFVMLLAIADKEGDVIGTDVAIARRLNMPLEEFQRCVGILGMPDPSSNSKDAEGKRVIPADSERGYKVVNYLKYRELTSEFHKKNYMRSYMRDYRQRNNVKLTESNSKTPASASESASESASGLKSKQPDSPFVQFWAAYPRKVAKNDAEKAFERHRLKGNLSVVLKALEEQKRTIEWTKEGGRFIPYPASWINSGRWEDDIPSLNLGTNENAKRTAPENLRNSTVCPPPPGQISTGDFVKRQQERRDARDAERARLALSENAVAAQVAPAGSQSSNGAKGC